MNNSPHRAIIVIGRQDPTEATFAEAQQYEEVFVLARAFPDPSDRWVIDGARADAAARGRLARTVARLRAHGIRVLGAVGDENAGAARDDARALFPAAQAILS
jgi:hypothetical protein